MLPDQSLVILRIRQWEHKPHWKWHTHEKGDLANAVIWTTSKMSGWFYLNDLCSLVSSRVGRQTRRRLSVAEMNSFTRVHLRNRLRTILKEHNIGTKPTISFNMHMLVVRHSPQLEHKCILIVSSGALRNCFANATASRNEETISKRVWDYLHKLSKIGCMMIIWMSGGPNWIQ